MKIVYKSHRKYKHQCCICGKPFDWNENSIFYGKKEYKTITEKKQKGKSFCSNECLQNFKQKK